MIESDGILYKEEGLISWTISRAQSVVHNTVLVN